MIVSILSLVGARMAAYLFQLFPLGTLESFATQQFDGKSLSSRRDGAWPVHLIGSGRPSRWRKGPPRDLLFELCHRAADLDNFAHRLASQIAVEVIL
jgi:hypothetical protein